MVAAMEWVVPTFAYIVGYLLAFRRIAGQLAWHMHAHPRYSWQRGVPSPTGGQWCVALSAALGFALIWPLSIPVAHALAGARSGVGLLYVPPKERERLMGERIAQLEREAGINS